MLVFNDGLGYLVLDPVGHESDGHVAVNPSRLDGGHGQVYG